MNIIQRNFFRMIRCGAFQQKEQVEPMSVYKWEQLYKLSVIHEVAIEVYEGLQACQDQFFLHLTDEQWTLWQKTIEEINKRSLSDDDRENKFLRPDYLTNPILNRKLQSILDDENSDIHTRQLLLNIIRCARHILNEGVPLKELIALGKELRTYGQRIDFFTIEKWTKQLKLQQMAQLEGSLLIEYLGFSSEDYPIFGGKADKNVEKVAQSLIDYNNAHAEDFYFSQDAESIFVHTSNGSAMLGHMRRSARYFRYFPSETLTNFFASFTHSLSHIEE